MIDKVIIDIFQQVYGQYTRQRKHPPWTIDRLIRVEAHNDREGCYLTGPRMARFLQAEGYEAVGCLGDTMDITSAKIVRFQALEDGVIWVSWCWGPYVPINIRKIEAQ